MRATLSVVFLFFLGKNRCETDLCSNKIGGDNHETEGKGKNRSQREVIHYRFIGILDYPQNEPAYTADTRKGVAVKYVTKSA